jgi:hypothetical protein
LLTGFESQVLLADVPLSVRGTGFGVQPTVLGASRVEVLDLGPARPLELVAVASLRAGS